MNNTYFIYLLCFIIKILYAESNYSNSILIGPNQYVIGINLDQNKYLNYTKYNILNPNNSTYIQNIIQLALYNIGNEGGGIVYILEGTYIVSRNLNINASNIQINGDGIDKTIIKLADNSPVGDTNDRLKYGFIRAENIDNFIVSNLTLNGNRNEQSYDQKYMYARYGIYTEECNQIWFDYVKVDSFQDYGFNPHGIKSDRIWANYLTISNCISQNNGWDGFTIDQTFYGFITNSLSQNNGRHGFNIVTGAKFINLDNNTAENNGINDNTFDNVNGCGFTVQNNFLFDTSDVIMNNNIITNNLKSGICLSDVYNINITNNVIGGDCNCDDKVDKSCTCLHLLNERSTFIDENVCNSLKFSNTNAETYLNTNTLNKIEYCPSESIANLLNFPLVGIYLIVISLIM